MAALRVAGRRAASYSICTKRSGGVETGLALYAASNGEPLRTAPPALYRGASSHLPSAGGWAALMAGGVRTPSTLAADPPRFLGTGEGAVGEKTANPLFPATGGGAVCIGGGPGVLRTPGTDPLPLGIGGGPGVLRTPGTDPLSLGIRGGPGVLRSTGTVAGFAGNRITDSTTRLIRGGGAWFRPATVGPATCTGVLLLPAPTSHTLRAFSSQAAEESSDDDGTPHNGCFHSLWIVEKKIGILERTIAEGQKSSSTEMQKIRQMLKIVISEQGRLHDTVAGSMSIKASLMRFLLAAILFAVFSVLIGVGVNWYLSPSYDEYKSDFVDFTKSLLRSILQDPEIRKDVEPYAEMGGAAIGRQFNPFYHFKRWWNKGKEGGYVMSGEEFSDKVTSFGFTVLTLLSSSDGTCTEDDLLNQLAPVGFVVKETNLALIKFLVVKGYIKKEIKSGIVWYTCDGGAIKDCKAGFMKARIAKLVKKQGTLEDFTS